MNIAVFIVALAAAALMGFAIQRGATCLVAAMEEVVVRQRASRFIALAEAAAVVAGGLVLAKTTGLLGNEPVGWAVNSWTVIGGVMLGLGAVTAGACAFGSIARLGSGDWAYLAVPPGFLVGALVGTPFFDSPGVRHVLAPSFVLQLAPILLIPFAPFVAWRLWCVVRAGRAGMLSQYVWSPHVATSVIAVTFVVLLLTAGPWSYTEVLAEAAGGMTMMTGTRLLLFVALLAGTVLGGWSAGLLKWVPVRLVALLRCFAGGAMMGLGAVLAPGNNDGLVLIGVPLLQPHALVALTTMVLTIAAVLLVRQDRPLATEQSLA